MVGFNIEEHINIKKQAISQSNQNKTVYVFIPISIPGMGKTTFKNIFEQCLKKVNKPLYSIEADDIRRCLMDREQNYC